MSDAASTLSPNDVARAHAELIENGVVHMEDRAQAAELAGRLPREGRPYFVKGARLKLGASSRQDRVERLGPVPSRS